MSSQLDRHLDILFQTVRSGKSGNSKRPKRMSMPMLSTAVGDMEERSAATDPLTNSFLSSSPKSLSSKPSRKIVLEDLDRDEDFAFRETPFQFDESTGSSLYFSSAESTDVYKFFQPTIAEDEQLQPHPKAGVRTPRRSRRPRSTSLPTEAIPADNEMEDPTFSTYSVPSKSSRHESTTFSKFRDMNETNFGESASSLYFSSAESTDAYKNAAAGAQEAREKRVRRGRKKSMPSASSSSTGLTPSFFVPSKSSLHESTTFSKFMKDSSESASSLYFSSAESTDAYKMAAFGDDDLHSSTLQENGGRVQGRPRRSRRNSLPPSSSSTGMGIAMANRPLSADPVKKPKVSLSKKTNNKRAKSKGSNEIANTKRNKERAIPPPPPIFFEESHGSSMYFSSAESTDAYKIAQEVLNERSGSPVDALEAKDADEDMAPSTDAPNVGPQHQEHFKLEGTPASTRQHLKQRWESRLDAMLPISPRSVRAFDSRLKKSKVEVGSDQ